MVRRAKLKRVNEGVTTEGSVRRGLGEKLIAFSEIGLIGNNIFGRGLIETQRLFCFYGTQLLLQFSNLCLLFLNLSLVLYRQQPFLVLASSSASLRNLAN
jgi:hypothetical protein